MITQEDIAHAAKNYAKTFTEEFGIEEVDFTAGALWAIKQLTQHKELTLTLENGEIKPAADGK